jgi:uncharacterized protein (DUF2342 family)
MRQPVVVVVAGGVVTITFSMIPEITTIAIIIVAVVHQQVTIREEKERMKKMVIPMKMEMSMSLIGVIRYTTGQAFCLLTPRIHVYYGRAPG